MSVATAAVAAATYIKVPPSFLGSLTTETLAALTSYAAGLGGAAAVFGTLFVPSPNSATVSGVLPGGSGLTYEFDRAAGVLRLRDRTGAIVAGGRRDRSGVFYDADTGVAIGRDIGSSLIFDQAAMTAAAADFGSLSRTKAGAELDELEREPKLCPEPQGEPDNKASDRAKAYQEQISALVNPQRPLPYGLAMAFFNPKGGKWVRADDCDELDGSLIEAKGPGFAKNLDNNFMRERYEDDFRTQAEAQVSASGDRDVRWYFAEQRTADFAADLFSRKARSSLAKIRVFHVEPIVK